MRRDETGRAKSEWEEVCKRLWDGTLSEVVDEVLTLNWLGVL